MSGLGPAACWLAHKRIESWSRLAKERVGAVRKSTDKSSDEKQSSSSPRTSMSIENDSFASSTEVSALFAVLIECHHLFMISINFSCLAFNRISLAVAAHRQRFNQHHRACRMRRRQRLHYIHHYSIKANHFRSVFNVHHRFLVKVV